jgi:4a-hydroxytetrahydrobiopterin dehydratase
MEKMTKEEVNKSLQTINNWELNDNSIQKKFTFKDFNEAIKVINQIADIANELNHHPELFNVYNKLEITLTTHDVNGLSELDFNFAKKVDSLIEKI